MVTILYSNTAAIRAAIGVTDKELPDALFTDQQLELQTKTSLYQWLPSYATHYEAGFESGATADAEHVTNLLTLYCLYYGAVRSIEMILAMRQSVSDGKQEVARFAIDWLALLETMKARLAEIVDALNDVLNLSSAGTAYFGLASPTYDPVANV